MSLQETLIKAREDRSLSLQEVFEETKISISVLKQFEEGRFDELPAFSFAKGHLKHYAQFLNLDPKPLIEELAQWNKEQDQQILIETPSVAESNIDWMGLNKLLFQKILPTLGILILIGGLFSLFKFSENLNISETLTPVSKVATDKIKSSDADLKETTKKLTPEDTESSQIAKKLLGSNIVATGSETLAGTTHSINTALATTKKTEDTTEVAAEDPFKHHVKVEPLDATVGFISVDGEKPIRIYFKPNKIRYFRGKENISIQAKDGGALNFFYNRKNLGVLGAFGQKLSVEFPKQSLPTEDQKNTDSTLPTKEESSLNLHLPPSSDHTLFS